MGQKREREREGRGRDEGAVLDLFCLFCLFCGVMKEPEGGEEGGEEEGTSGELTVGIWW